MTTQNEHYDKNRESRIPKFANREEEAAFWDNHDISDYWDELKPVKLKVAKNLSKGITIRFDEETLGELRRQAMSPELHKAFEESWHRNEPGYRYLAEH